MGLFSKKHDEHAEQLRGLREQLEAMAQRLDRSEADKVVLIEQVTTLEETMERQRTDMAQRLDRSEAEKGALVAQVGTLEETIEEQRARLADLALVATALHGEEDNVRSQLGQIAERMGALDGRVGQISTELVNQLDELGGELDALGRAVEANDVSEIRSKLDEVTAGQAKLANEQARYEIQFREDLADVADRLRPPRPR